MKELRSIALKVDLFAGTDIKDACWEICELANRVGCLVEAKFNGVLLWARQGDNPLKIADAYEVELGSQKTLKIAQDK
jgi:hypothetical protein